MVALSIQIEGQDGLTWSRWKKLVDEVETLGFAGLYRSDHFTNGRPPDKASLEMIVSLTYLADHTQHVVFGPLVAPLSFRHPMLLARQATALDDLSGGRMYLGLGAGWQEREHTLFGFELGDIPTRMARLEEGLEVITRLLKSDDPVTFEGHFYQLRGATLLPRPQRPGGPRILLGGNGVKRTLPLVARYADVWNGTFLSPADFRERSTALDALLSTAGRKSADVRRSVMLGLFFGNDMLEVDKALSWRRTMPDLADKPLDTVIETIQTQGRALVGTPEHIIRQIAAYASAGVDELMLQWFDMDDIKGLRNFAESVLPRI
ncbi:MAG TPA: TIGR03560 family F420-dependent LLM class oxidoreductase [Ktedonobacteraceae bacterium]|nr:TIGR03560 family F420-dependent LLM class oxidoreductase [Ktedonobacteraceae bacterium]